MKKLLIAFVVILVLLIGVILIAAIANDLLAASTAAESHAAPNTPETSHAHRFDSWQTIKEATCTEDGESARTCKICDYQETRTVSATGHKWLYATCETPKTCQVCQLVEGEPLGHNIVNGYCTLCKRLFNTELDVKKFLKIVDVHVSIGADNAVSVGIGWENTSEKAIKYIHFDVMALNASGEILPNEDTNESTVTLSGTGPYPAGAKLYTINAYGQYEKSRLSWDGVWRSAAVDAIAIDRIHLLYEDGSRVEFDSKQVEQAFGPVTLSTTIKELKADSIHFRLANSGQDEILFRETESITLSLISDEGYPIRKTGELALHITASQTERVLFSQTFSVTNESYDERNGLILEVPLELHEELIDNIDVSVVFSPSGEEASHTLSCVGTIWATN